MLLEAASEAQIIAATTACRRLGVPCCLLGEGSNVVVDDAGLAGLVVINRVATVCWGLPGRSVTVGGGFNLDRFVTAVSQRGWGDITFAAGIPGTVGGGIVGGAGAYGHLAAERLTRARILDTAGRVADIDASRLGIRYRNSDALLRGDILLAATFGGFGRDEPETLADRIETIKAKRRRKLPPADLPCAGSFFKNLPSPAAGGRRIPAGRLLDQCGAKQMREGGAAVFHNHANIIVNTGDASAADIDRLADRLARRVRRRMGIELTREVRFLRSSPADGGLV